MRALSVHNSTVTVLSRYADVPPVLADSKNHAWIDILAPGKEDLDFLENTLKLHPLVLEDMAHERQRPKVEPYDEYTYMVVRMLDPEHVGTTHQLNIILGPNYLLTVHNRPMPFLEETWQRAAKNTGLLSHGADFALYSLLDVFVDSLFPLVGEMDADLDAMGEKVFKDASPEVLAKLFHLKRRLFNTRKAITPLRDVLTVLARHDTTLISKKNAVYFRDVYDHMLRIIESLDNGREMVTSSMEGYLSAVSNNLNVIMKKLTAITAIIMVPSLIAGIYGMNFPDLAGYEFGGTTAALGLMVLSVAILGIYFKRRGWL